MTEQVNSIEELTASRTALIEVSRISDPYVAVLAASKKFGDDVEFRDYMETCMVEFLNKHKNIRSILNDQNSNQIIADTYSYTHVDQINNIIRTINEIKKIINQYFDDEKLDRNDKKNYYDIYWEVGALLKTELMNKYRDSPLIRLTCCIFSLIKDLKTSMGFDENVIINTYNNHDKGFYIGFNRYCAYTNYETELVLDQEFWKHINVEIVEHGKTWRKIVRLY